MCEGKEVGGSSLIWQLWDGTADSLWLLAEGVDPWGAPDDLWLPQAGRMGLEKP